jgi:hypothetical protein
MATPYLPGGLTLDDLERSLAMSQGRASMPPVSDPAPVPPPQQMEPAQPPQQEPLPDPFEVPAQPEPAAVQESESVEQLPPTIERPTGKPRQNIRELENKRLDVGNQRIENVAGLGDEQGLRADDYAQMSDINKRSAGQNKATADAAKSDLQKSRAREEEWRNKAKQLWQWGEANKHPPPDSTTQKVLGIIGSILTMGSNKSGTAAGVQMLTSLLGSDHERWEKERAANSDLYKQALANADHERATQADHLEASQKVQVLEGHEIIDSLKAVQNMGLGKHANAVAKDLELKLGDSLIGGLVESERQMQKEAAAAEAKRMSQREAAQRDDLSRMSEPQLQALMDRGGLGEVGQQILAAKVKNRQAGLKGEADVLEAQNKALNEGGDGKMSADERKVQRLLAGVAPSVENLRKMAASGEAPSHPYSEYVPDIVRSKDALSKEADLRSVADILLRDESGAAIGADEQRKKLAGWGITSGDPDVRRRGLKKMLAEYEARLTGKAAYIDEDADPVSKYKTFKRDAPAGPKSAQQLAQDYLDSRGGAGAGGI